MKEKIQIIAVFIIGIITGILIIKSFGMLC